MGVLSQRSEPLVAPTTLDLATLTALLSQAPDHILLVSREGVIEYLNYPFPAHTVEEVIGTLIWSYIDSADTHANMTRALNSVFGGSGPVSYEASVIFPSGERRWYRTRVSPVSMNDEVVAAAMIATDITATRVLERQLAQSQKLESIGQLAAGIAHEINTPVQYIGDNLRFLADAFRDLDAVAAKCAELHGPSTTLNVDLEYTRQEVPRAIAQALEGVAQVARIVRAMKDFSHPGVEEPIESDLNHALESTIAVARNEWKQVADMVTQLDPELPAVRCVPGDLNQAFLNIIVNAAHAIAEVVGTSGDKGTITVRTKHLGDAVAIEIEDTGPGIPDAVADRIYDPFFTTKPVGKGTGQGLAIAHHVVEKHAGRIHFESSPHGTVFHIWLPVGERDPLFSKIPAQAP